MKNVIFLIKQEIKWHLNNKGTSGKGSAYEKGFIDALSHIHKLFSNNTKNLPIKEV